MTANIENYRERAPLIHPHAAFLDLGHAAIVGRHKEAESIGECALADLTNLSRLGLRGPAAAERLAAEGFQRPEAPNRLTRADTGEALLRLSQNEYFLLGSLSDKGARVRALESALPRAGENGLYFLPRQDSHAWFWIGGPRRVDIMAKLCGVDLSPVAFAGDAVAQTSVARLNAIVASDERGDAFHLLFDRPSARYFWDALLDAMREFGGGPVGFTSVQGG